MLENGVIPLSVLPAEVKEIRVVTDITARNNLTGLFNGLNVYVVDATADTTVSSGGAYYLYNNNAWIKTAESESLDLVLSWANITGKPDFDATYIKKALQMTADNGNVEFLYNAASEADMLDKIGEMGVGMHTAYFAAGLGNVPKAGEAWRVLVHKTTAAIGWVLAFGSSGSIYSNYQYGEGTFRGWKCIASETTAPLWTGAKYMNDGQTLTIPKPLSQCKNGWMLEWSDYDEDTSTANNYNIVHTPIYKRNAVGNWTGNNMMVAVPNYVSTDGLTTAIVVKQLLIADSTITGHASNVLGDSKDVCLKAVYEF